VSLTGDTWRTADTRCAVLHGWLHCWLKLEQKNAELPDVPGDASGGSMKSRILKSYGDTRQQKKTGGEGATEYALQQQ